MGTAGQYAQFQISSDRAHQVRAVWGKPLRKKLQRRLGVVLRLHEPTSSRKYRLHECHAANAAVLQVFKQEVIHPDVTKPVVRKSLFKFLAVEGKCSSIGRSSRSVRSSPRKLNVSAEIEAMKTTTSKRHEII